MVSVVWKPLCVCVYCVRLFATPWTIAHQAPLSTQFSRQECWSPIKHNLINYSPLDELGGCLDFFFFFFLLFQMKSWAVWGRRFGLYVAWNQMGLLDLFETIMLFQRHAVWLVRFHCTERESKIYPHGSITQTWQLYPLPGPFWALSLSLSPSLEITNKTLGLCVVGRDVFSSELGLGLQPPAAVPELSPAALSTLKAKKQASKGGNVARKLGGPVFSFFAWFIFSKKKQPRGKIIHMERLLESDAQR